MLLFIDLLINHSGLNPKSYCIIKGYSCNFEIEDPKFSLGSGSELLL